MGTLLNPKDRFLGVPLTIYRDMLRRWIRYHEVRDVVSNRKIPLSPQAAAVLVNEADIAGFFNVDDRREQLSNRGRGFLAASSLKPMKRERAAEIIAEILANCGDINRRDDLCFHVDRVWLFGSYVNGSSTVNDIDIVVETSLIPDRWDQVWRKRAINLACDMGGEHVVFGRCDYSYNALTYLEKKLTYGARKNPRVSPHYVDTLKDLACECQLVFDRSRNGPVSDPVLAKHPEAGNRSDNIYEKATMPDLESADVGVPVKVDFAFYYSPRFSIFDRVDLRPIETEPAQISGLSNEWLSSLGNVDGRSRAIVAYEPDYDSFATGVNTPPFALVLDRAIVPEGDAIHYSVTLSRSHLGGRRVMSSEVVKSIAATILLAIGADLEAISMKSGDQTHRLSLDLTADDRVADPVRRLVEAELRQALLPHPSRADWLSPAVRERIAAGSMQIDVGGSSIDDVRSVSIGGLCV